MKKATFLGSAVITAAVLLVMACWAGNTLARPKISGIAEVEIYVSDRTTADNFYSKLNPLMGTCRICRWQAHQALFPTGQELISSANTSTAASNHLRIVGFQIDDLRAMMAFLKSKKIPFQTELPVDGDGYLTVVDPEGHEIHFIEFGHSHSWLSISPEIRKAAPAPIRLIHAGFVVKDREAMDKFYKDVLGFHVYWSGGMKDGETDWVDMQVPDGTDWIEYMLNVPPNASHKTLGVMNHIALGVPDIHAAQQQLIKNGWKGAEQPKIGRDGKWQLNLYDPDETRVELMEFTPVEKPCCSEYTGPHPKP
jgi:catechol 2,3-dioxygenase-like lactoylglutathione lyase family enzyme